MGSRKRRKSRRRCRGSCFKSFSGIFLFLLSPISSPAALLTKEKENEERERERLGFGGWRSGGGEESGGVVVERGVGEEEKEVVDFWGEGRPAVGGIIAAGAEGEDEGVVEGLLRERRIAEFGVAAAGFGGERGIHEDLVACGFGEFAVGEHADVLVGRVLKDFDGGESEESFTCSHDGLERFLRGVILTLLDDASEELADLLDEAEEVVAGRHGGQSPARSVLQAAKK